MVYCIYKDSRTRLGLSTQLLVATIWTIGISGPATPDLPRSLLDHAVEML